MSAGNLRKVIDLALTDEGFRDDLVGDPAKAIDQSSGLDLSASDFTEDEFHALKLLKKSDITALAELKRGLPDIVAEHTGGLIL